MQANAPSGLAFASVNDIEAAVAKRALVLATQFAQYGPELRGMAGDFTDWQSLRDFLLEVTGAIRASGEDEMVRHYAFSLVVATFDPRGETEIGSN
jgi:hypothetical protein